MAREKLYKKCPRCGEKTFAQARVCDGCKLVFARMEFASNKKAKQQIKRGNRDAVIRTNQLPKDVNYWALLFICFFGGFAGAHSLFVGRYLKGFVCLGAIVILCGLMLALPAATLATFFNNWMFLPYGIITYLWLYDLFLIAIKKYKVPVALDIPDVEVLSESK